MTYAGYPVSGGGGSGDVQGPASSVDNGVVLFDGTTGKLLKDLGVGSANQILKTDGTAPSFGLLVNANVDASAAIDYSKLASLTSGNILVGSAGNVATSVAMTGDVTISNTGVTAISAGVIVNADINASAAIAFSKMEALTASRALETDVSGFIVASAVTSTELGYVSGVTSGIQGQIDGKLSLTGGTLTGALTITPTSNQLVLGTTNTTTISATAPSSSITLTIPDAGTNADFILSESAQTINGAKTFSNTITGDISGNAGTVTDGAYLSASQSFTGANTFTQTITGDISGNAGTVTNGAYVNVTNSFTSTQNILATTNQLVLGTTNTTTISATAPSASRVYTMPDVGGNADFVMTAGAQEIGGAKTFTGEVTLSGGVSGTTDFAGLIDIDAGADSRLRLYNSTTQIGQLQATASEMRVAAVGSFPLVLHTAGSEKVRIDASGNVGIGTASPLASLHTAGNAFINNGAADNYLYFSRQPGVFNRRAWVAAIAGTTGNAQALSFGTNLNGADGTEKMSISETGAVTLGPSGSTSTSLRHVFNIPDAASLVYTTTPQVQISSASASGNGFPIIGMFNSGTETTSYNILGSYIDDSTTPLYALRFEVRQNDGTAFSSRPSTEVAWAWTDTGFARMLLTHAGALSTSTGSLGTISDAALKNTIENLDKGLAEVLALQPRKWQWNKPENHAESPTYGFVAQEAETIIPEMVTKVGKFKNVQCGTATTAILVKAIQELHAELQALKGA